ncbi:LamG-like jellyroll fold domain-containing protein [Paenibacillus sp. HB172176]|uniref:LamG-like jellyroll fold domain-containing protein n=1 Tax=Paenibacillus sp. HB172176 TaxID=2493690 RepID=UPI00143B8401|nr:LamG-like jellyroll fold domain-containing protein [Paenibacillus sp. HB172176]
MKKIAMICLSIMLSLMFVSTREMRVHAAESITVDVANVVKTFSASNKPIGLNATFLMDSDLYHVKDKSSEEQYREMQAGSLRFPYGHLANNYLWDADGTYGGTLTPKVAAMSQAPGVWEWAVNADGTFKSAMDFDEYMAICERNGIEPLVVVNVMAHRYADGPSFSELVDSAAAWVKYAKDKGYNVTYWQLGNEQDHHADALQTPYLPLKDTDGVLDDDNYVDVYKQIAAAMKAEDPSIKTGPGILNNQTWFNTIYNNAAGYVDFASAHQYSFGKAWAQDGYEAWRDWTGDMTDNVTAMETNAENKGLDLFVTETNAFGSWPEGQGVNDAYRALALFEMQMQQIAMPNVAYTYIWNTRTPWGGEHGDGGLANVLYNDSTGNRTPLGEIVKIINENLFDQLVDATEQSGYVRAYASYDSSGHDLNVFLLNKDSEPVDVDVSLDNYDTPSGYERFVFKGSSCGDYSPQYDRSGSIALSGDAFSTTLEGCSLTVVKFSPSQLGLWTFDETGGTTAADASGNGNDAALYGGAAFAAGKFANALQLDGIDDHAELPAVIDPGSSDYTAAAWVKLDSAQGTRQIILQQLGSGATWLFRDSATGTLGSWGGSALASTSQIPLGEWTHVAVTSSGADKKLYVNGQLEDSSASSSPYASTAGMRVGMHKSPDATNEEWDGEIDDLRIYGKALSEAELLAMIHEGTQEAPHADPVAAEYFVGMTRGAAPSGWYVNALSGSASVEGITDSYDAVSPFNNSLKLSDTGTDKVYASYSFSAQSGKMMLNFGLKVDSFTDGAWVFVSDNSTVALKLKVDDSDLIAFDGGTPVVVQTDLFQGYDKYGVLVKKTVNLTLIVDPGENTYSLVSGGNVVAEDFAFEHAVSDVSKFAVQTVEADEDYDVYVHFMNVLPYVE